MKQTKTLSILVIVGLLLSAAGTAIAQDGGANTAPQTVEIEPTPQIREGLYKQIWSLIANQYVDETKLTDWAARYNKYDGKLNSEADLDAALKDLVGSVGDRWTMYRGRKELREFQNLMKEGNVLSGIMPRKHADGAWRIDSLIYGSAAHKSGLKEGDILLSVNGKKLDKLSDDQVLMTLIGKPGETMKIVAFWDGKEHEVEITLFPPLPDRVVVGELPNEILYIRLPTFEKTEVIDDFVNQLKRKYFEKKGALTGLVLDLRNNSGGLFDMALKTSSLFLESGTITKATMHNGQSETVTEHRVRPMPPFAKRMTTEPHMLEFLNWLFNTPMVILINGSTASSSEVTAGALQDNKRAYVIGTHSFGKAVAYTIQELPNGGRFFMTTLRYLTPAGHDVYDKGIQPDLVVDQPRLGTEDLALKAAHDYIVKLAAQRYNQVKEAVEIVGKPAGELKNDRRLDSPPFIIFGIELLGALIVAFFLARKTD
jgi:C-terminal processing protease CtpA/Prc